MCSAWHVGINLVNTDQTNPGSGQDDRRGNVEEQLIVNMLMFNVLGEI